MKIRRLFAELKARGWRLDRVKGSHHVFVHDRAPRCIVVPVHGREMPAFYAKAVLKQADVALNGR